MIALIEMNVYILQRNERYTDDYILSVRGDVNDAKAKQYLSAILAKMYFDNEGRTEHSS